MTDTVDENRIHEEVTTFVSSPDSIKPRSKYLVNNATILNKTFLNWLRKYYNIIN